MFNPELYRQIASLRNEGFSHEQASRPYFISRGLKRNKQRTSYGDTKLPAYGELLPKVNGKKVDKMIGEIIKRNGTCDILDVGCGKGRFLVEAKEKWKNKIGAYGLSAFPYYADEQDEHDIRTYNVSSPWTNEKGVNFAVGDAQRLRHSLKSNGFPEKFDVIVSVFSMMYVPDQLAFIKGIHDSLKVGGIGLVRPGSATGEIAGNLANFFAASGILQVDNEYPQDSSYILRKDTDKRLHFPISYNVATDSMGAKQISYIHK